MSARTACFPFLPLIPRPASSPACASYFYFRLKCCDVIGRRFERLRCQIDGRRGACLRHAGLTRSIERTPLCPHPSSLSPNHPVMENAQDGGGGERVLDDRRTRTCVCAAQQKQLYCQLWEASSSSFILEAWLQTVKTSQTVRTIWKPAVIPKIIVALCHLSGMYIKQWETKQLHIHPWCKFNHFAAFSPQLHWLYLPCAQITGCKP